MGDWEAPLWGEGEKSLRKIRDDDGRFRCLVKRVGFFSSIKLSIRKELWEDIGRLMNWKLK